MVTNYGAIINSKTGLMKIQSFDIPLEDAIRLSEVIVLVQDRVKAYEMSRQMIDDKHKPVDENGDFIYDDETKKSFTPLDYNKWAEDVLTLDTTEVELTDVEPIIIELTDEIRKNRIATSTINTISWLIKFVRPVVKDTE